MSSSFTTTICRIAPISCTHRAKIIGHSLTKGFHSDDNIQLGTFSLGGYQWAIIYHPNYKFDNCTYASFRLRLLSEAKHVMVFLSFSLVNESGAASVTDTHSGCFTYTKKGDEYGFYYFKARSDLDKSIYVKDIRCKLVEVWRLA
jgi:hypothetical protein